MSAEDRTHVKHISFQNSAKADRIAGLKLNRLLNVRVRHEWLEDVSVLAAARCKGKRGTVGQMIMKSKTKGIPIFNGVEQGIRKNKNRACVCFKPNMIDEAKE